MRVARPSRLTLGGDVRGAAHGMYDEDPGTRGVKLSRVKSQRQAVRSLTPAGDCVPVVWWPSARWGEAWGIEP